MAEIVDYELVEPWIFEDDFKMSLSDYIEFLMLLHHISPMKRVTFQSKTIFLYCHAQGFWCTASLFKSISINNSWKITKRRVYEGVKKFLSKN